MVRILEPSELLDLLKAALGLTSDYKVSKYFGLTTQAVGSWRKNASYPSDSLLIEMANAAHIDPAVLLLHAAIWRGRQKAQGRIWQKVLESYGDDEIAIRSKFGGVKPPLKAPQK